MARGRDIVGVANASARHVPRGGGVRGAGGVEGRGRVGLGRRSYYVNANSGNNVQISRFRCRGRKATNANGDGGYLRYNFI